MTLALEKLLGAPGIYCYREVPFRALTGARMDVCAFLGVAPRGPAREPVLDLIARDCRPDPRTVRKLRRTVPVAVESFDEYRRLYGGFEGPGLLPYAVASFFEQGGQRAYIARIVHEYPTAAENAGRVAEGVVGGAITPSGPLRLRARDEGTWGNKLRASISFRYTPLNVEVFSPPISLTVTKGELLPAGTLLRLTLPGGIQMLRFVTQVIEEGLASEPGSIREATLAQAVTQKPARTETGEGEPPLDDGHGRGVACRPRAVGASSLLACQRCATAPGWFSRMSPG